ncbi:hypothetical protein Elgi_36270 [Paenibacillus elgii]|uniref:hypothetical protein n=1 Tax=Paenibacillus elgii TaxID=189691 RepID=UPI002D7C2AD0|nr:hypothetical protein Elgi_36270 [Paenibacillus elgii]
MNLFVKNVFEEVFIDWSSILGLDVYLMAVGIIMLTVISELFGGFRRTGQRYNKKRSDNWKRKKSGRYYYK